ncbi:MAG: UDP-N-acetylmuramoyl-L-alanyl-D-glutamate--2,6-diaminopimelate ligase [Pseudomonadales bacterium]
MTEYSVELPELLAGLIDTVQVPKIAITGVALDSRLLGSGCAFVALQGSTSHGIDFAEKALSLGAAVVLHDGLTKLPALSNSANYIEVVGLREKLGTIAHRFYNTANLSIPCIAVTGTNGKTSCVQNIASMFSNLQRKAGSIGTLGWGFGDALESTGLTTPDVLTLHRALRSMVDSGAAAVAIEASSHALAQGRLDGIAISTAVFTNLSRDHLDYHGDLASYADAKAMLFERDGLKNAVLNADDPYYKELSMKVRCSGELVSYSSTDSNASVYAKNIHASDKGVTAQLVTPWGRGEVHLAQIGLFNLQNLLAAISVLCLEGEALDQVLEKVPELEPVPGRMQLLPSETGPKLVVDYAHTPDGLLKALQAITQHCDGQVWVVFGCGGDRDKGKRPEMAAIAEQYADKLVITSDNPRSESPEAIINDIVAGLGKSVNVTQTRDSASVATHTAIVDRASAIETAVNEAGVHDWVLIAGKGHEKYQQLANERIAFDDVLVAQAAHKRRGARAQGYAQL